MKVLKGGHLSHAIGRMVAQDQKMKNTLENATRTRMMVAIHLGDYERVRVARRTVSKLIRGDSPVTLQDDMLLYCVLIFLPSGQGAGNEIGIGSEIECEALNNLPKYPVDANLSALKLSSLGNILVLAILHQKRN